MTKLTAPGRLHGPGQALCQPGGIHRPPLDAKGVHSSRHAAEDLLSLLLQSGGNLRRGRVAGKPGLRQLDQLPPAEGTQTLFILRHRVPPIRLLQFSHTDQLYCQHSAFPLKNDGSPFPVFHRSHLQPKAQALLIPRCGQRGQGCSLARDGVLFSRLRWASRNRLAPCRASSGKRAAQSLLDRCPVPPRIRRFK